MMLRNVLGGLLLAPVYATAIVAGTLCAAACTVMLGAAVVGYLWKGD